MINVAKHAYPPEFEADSKKGCLKRWWMSAKADRGTNTLTIVVYDQGATIPGTLPNRGWFQEMVVDGMRQFIPFFEYDPSLRTLDHEYINFSMKKGRTQTGDTQRGLGLPQMQDLIDECPDGTLSIFSRKGLYRYSKGIGVYKEKLGIELEGTLIEWELALPRGNV